MKESTGQTELETRDLVEPRPWEEIEVPHAQTADQLRNNLVCLQFRLAPSQLLISAYLLGWLISHSFFSATTRISPNNNIFVSSAPTRVVSCVLTGNTINYSRYFLRLELLWAMWYTHCKLRYTKILQNFWLTLV